jgi:hypothetical protein
VRRFLLVILLAPVLVGFPTPPVSANDSAAPSTEGILYWTGSAADQQTECAANPDRLSSCVDEVYLGARKLEYRTKEELAAMVGQNFSSIYNYIQVIKHTSEFRCWSPTWPITRNHVQPPTNEVCSYSQFSIQFFNNVLRDTSVDKPTLTVKVRKIKGDHPASHLGFLHSTGPVHEFIPTTATNEFATVTMSPGFVVGGKGSFNTSLQTLDIPEYARNEGSWTYGFFLATSNVTGFFDMNSGFEMLPESSGAWQASNASAWGFFGDYWKPDYAIRVTGPHFKYKANPSDPDVLNTAWFTAYMPRALVQRKFGITPEQANETTLSVTRSVGRNPTQLPSIFTATKKGLLIETDGITFSKPAITISRRVQVKNRKSLSVKNIVASAGIPKRDRGSARISSSPCRSSQRNCSVSKGRVTFTKPGRYVFQVTYTTKDARKRAVQRRHQVTVRVR